VRINDLRLSQPIPVSIKSAEAGRIEGLASTFGGAPDRAGDIVQRGAFVRTLCEHREQNTVPALLWAHQIEAPIGKWTELREADTGLYAAGRINLETTTGREAFEHVKAGDASGLSIGYLIPEGGRKYNGNGTFTIVDCDLCEISIVAVPANPRAKLTQVKSLGSKAELFDLLREAGLAKVAAARVAAAGWPALNSDDREEKAIRLAAEIERFTSMIRSK
jgi:HK97 family phage prohead protease